MPRWFGKFVLVMLVAALAVLQLGAGMKAYAAEPAGIQVSKVFNGSVGARSWYEYRSSEYVPGKGTRLIIVLGDNGQTGKDVAMTGDWIEIAEKDGGIAIFPDPQNGVWSLEDIAFLRELYGNCTSGTYSIASASRYIVGTGAGGKLAAEWAVQDTARFAALATVNAPAADLGALKPANQPLPVLMLSASGTFDQQTVEYFKNANGVTAAKAGTNEVKYFKQGGAPWNEDFTKTNYIRLVTKQASGPEASRFVWNDLFNTVRRWATIEGQGTLRARKVAADIGLVRIVEQDTINNLSREAFVYIPSQVKTGKIAAPVPVVMLFHGVTANGEYHADQTEWWKIAEKYNFILYSPTGVNNRWDVGNWDGKIRDLEYFSGRIDEFVANGITVDGKNYRIDSGKIYLTGFSNGCRMVNTMAMKYPEKITAIAGFSAPANPGKDADPAVVKPVPVWLGLGEKDENIPVRHFDKDMLVLLDFWKGLAGCGPDEIPVVTSDSILGISGNLVTRIYKSGSVEIRFTDEKNIVHGMPNELPEKVWVEFFARYKKQDGASVEIR
ncbi:MAG: PHB depolymerase family esterase [Negativicutes bacterium]|nr:PHB depolymerase family esterase [Negativicutes bacterium]